MAEKRLKIAAGLLTEDKLYPLLSYITDTNITDIDWNGTALWLRDIHNRRWKENNPAVTPEYINSLVMHIANAVSQSFNVDNQILECEMDKMRFTCVHESLALRGRTICIRKVQEKPRLTYSGLKGIYCDEGILNLLINHAAGNSNIVSCGNPGVGKTEFAKFLSLFIPDNAKVITIEDTREWYYSKLKPEADGIELITSEKKDYTQLIKTSVRLNPGRIMLAETRSVEAAELLEAWSTGMKGITTLHTDDLRNVPDRFLNMMNCVGSKSHENNIYDYLDAAVLIKAAKNADGTYTRYIDQIAYYERDRDEKKITFIVEDGQRTDEEIPDYIRKKFSDELISNPYVLDNDLKEKVKFYEGKKEKKE